MGIGYENQGIAQFLLLLGWHLKSRAVETKGFINLFQQTPADPALSDLFGSPDNVRFFMVEFKRAGGNETNKGGIRKNVIRQVKAAPGCPALDQRTFGDISAKAHLFCELSTGVPDGQFYPYIAEVLGFETPEAKSYCIGRQFESMEEFFDKGFFGNGLGVDKKSFTDYLTYIYKGIDEDTSDADHIPVLAFAVTNGAIAWAATENLRDLLHVRIPTSKPGPKGTLV